MRARSLLSPALLACLLLCAPTSSCKLISGAANAPGKIADDILGGGKKPTDRIPASILQAGVMRFSDTFASSITHATQEFAAKADKPEANIQALSWSIGQSTAAFTIASGPNPNSALLDMIVLVTLGRMVHEEYWMPKVWGEADRPMLEAFTQLEQRIWEVAGQMLEPAQQEEVRATLREWREKNPDMGITAFVKLPMFQDMFKQRTEAQANKGAGLGDLLSMDPLGGLEPAVREIEQTRLFAERSMFYLQRTPILLSNQVELLSLKLMRMTEVQRALDDTQRVSEAAASLAATAAALPEAVRVEREAAVKQISSELAEQRQGLMTDLEAAEAPSRKILGEARTTIEAGTQLSTALKSTIESVDKFMARFDTKELPAGAAPKPAEPPGKPFDVVEYGDAATRLGTAAHELNGLVTTLDQSLPQVQRVLDEVEQRGTRTIDRAFTRGLQLGGSLIAFMALAILGVRWLSARMARSPRKELP